MAITESVPGIDDCELCGSPSRDCTCACAIEDCESFPRFICGWCDSPVCDDHANTYSGLCPDCQQEYEDGQA